MERMGAQIAAVLIAAVLLLAAGPARTQTVAPVPPPPGTQAAPQAVPQAPPPPSADTAIDTALLLGAAENRMTVPVSIGAHGLWPFIIDTGAERTVVSRQLAKTLGLAAGPPLRVVAMTGPSAVASVVVPALSVSSLAQPTITAPRWRRNIWAPSASWASTRCRGTASTSISIGRR